MDKSKVILIVGETGKIGRELKKLLKGYKVVATYFENKHPDAKYKLDIRKVEEIEKLVEKIKNEFGKVDVVINCASSFKKTPTPFSPEEWDEHIETNLKGAVFLTMKISKIMPKTGCIINFGDAWTDEEEPSTNFIPYLVSKKALEYALKLLSRTAEVKLKLIKPRFANANTLKEILNELKKSEDINLDG